MRVLALTLAALLTLNAGIANAAPSKGDIMPPPQKAPRVPVEREPLKAPKEAREFEGKAKAIDGERLIIGDKEIRLFGIVTPGISSNYGPQARQRLDQIIKGAVLCKVTDKDKDGRPIAFCGTVDTPDLSYEMLRQGWAMVDRKALKNNSLAVVYEKVEQEAQSQNKGLFAPMPMVSTVPLSNPSNSVTVPLVVSGAAAAAIKTETVKTETVKTEIKSEQPAPESSKVEVKTDGGVVDNATALSLIQSVTTKPVSTKSEPIVVSNGIKEPTARLTQETTFFERYQSFIGSLIWLAGVFAFGAAVVTRDKLQLIEKRKALAAALHGELTAARQICRTRSRELMRQKRLGEDDAQPRPSQLWPRIRALVYQAHVGTIGLLGSDLARRVASIYGQCADYATYYQQTAAQRLPSATAVSETLSALADHMDNILDGLAQVEYSGKPFVPEIVDDAVVVDDYEQEEVQEQQAKLSVNEEAKLIKARFERMATSMVEMISRKREEYAPAPKQEAKPAKEDGASAKKPSQAA